MTNELQADGRITRYFADWNQHMPCPRFVSDPRTCSESYAVRDHASNQLQRGRERGTVVASAAVPPLLVLFVGRARSRLSMGGGSGLILGMEMMRQRAERVSRSADSV